MDIRNHLHFRAISSPLLSGSILIAAVVYSQTSKENKTEHVVIYCIPNGNPVDLSPCVDDTMITRDSGKPVEHRYGERPILSIAHSKLTLTSCGREEGLVALILSHALSTDHDTVVAALRTRL